MSPALSASIPPAAASGTLAALDWLNFVLADVQTGVGPFLAIYLATAGWDEAQVGLLLGISERSAVKEQFPRRKHTMEELTRDLV